VALWFRDTIDPKVFDGAVNGIGTFLTSGAERSRRLQTGLVRSYAAVFLFGVVVIFAALLVRASFS
jgi:NADH-quinone oxidoreductase subunit L